MDSLPYLPEEIINQIISWLTAKALLKCRCVSKSWLAVISSPELVNSHMENMARHRLYSLTDTSSLMTKAAVLRDPQVVVGCCNGLVCAVSKRDKVIKVWNPATREYRVVPWHGGMDDVPADMEKNTYGFGYDSSNDDFKVIEITHYLERNIEIKIFSLRFHAWTFMWFDRAIIPYGTGVFMDGVVYWGARDDMHKYYAFGVNMTTEECMLIEYPETGHVLSMGVSEDRRHLCLFGLSADGPSDDMETWMLKQERSSFEKFTWTKGALAPRFVPNPFILPPVGGAGQDEVADREEKPEMWSFDEESVLFLKLPLTGRAIDNIRFVSTTYSESPMSPNIMPDRYEERKLQD